MNINRWAVTTPETFLGVLNVSGNPNNRYGLYGFYMRSEYLHKLDAMVFSIRRMICRLDDCFMPPNSQTNSVGTYRKFLERQPTLSFNGSMPLDKLIKDKDSPRRRAFLNLNIPFAPDDYPHEPIPDGWFTRNAAIYRRLLEPLRSGQPSSVQEAAQAWEWTKANIYIPGSDQKYIEKKIAEALKRLEEPKASE